MKSDIKTLRSRGFFNKCDISAINDLKPDKIIELLYDRAPDIRSAAVQKIAELKNESHIPILCELLKNERKLYTKIALSEALISYGAKAAPFLTALFGKIGNNQHNKPAMVDLKKLSFPLPRDITARIIARIGPAALDELEKVLECGDLRQITEAIDAIGHIAYNFKDIKSENALFETLNKYPRNELIIWKIIRAFQAFSSERVKEYLLGIVNEEKDEILIAEANRSLDRIKRNRSTSQ